MHDCKLSRWILKCNVLVYPKNSSEVFNLSSLCFEIKASKDWVNQNKIIKMICHLFEEKILQDTLYSVSVIGSGRQENVNYQVRNQKSWGGGKKLVAFMRVEQIAKGEEGKKNRGSWRSLFRHIPEPLAERLLWLTTMWHLPQNLSHFEIVFGFHIDTTLW